MGRRGCQRPFCDEQGNGTRSSWLTGENKAAPPDVGNVILLPYEQQPRPKRGFRRVGEPKVNIFLGQNSSPAIVCRFSLAKAYRIFQVNALAKFGPAGPSKYTFQIVRRSTASTCRAILRRDRFLSL